MSHSCITFRLIMVVCFTFYVQQKDAVKMAASGTWVCMRAFDTMLSKNKAPAPPLCPLPLLTLGGSEVVWHNLNSWSLYIWTQHINSFAPIYWSAATDQVSGKKNIFEISYLSFQVCHKMWISPAEKMKIRHMWPFLEPRKKFLVRCLILQKSFILFSDVVMKY